MTTEHRLLQLEEKMRRIEQRENREETHTVNGWIARDTALCFFTTQPWKDYEDQLWKEGETAYGVIISQENDVFPSVSFLDNEPVPVTATIKRRKP